MLETMIKMLFSNQRTLNEEMSEPKFSDIKSNISNVDKIHEEPLRYQRDIDALTDTYGALYRSQIINISLTDLLEICPRKRRRIEAYQGLISELKGMGIELNISSRKTKPKE